MNYNLIPSLEHIALVKIAITLWNQDDIRALIAKFYFQIIIGREIREKWQKIEYKVVKKLPQLSQPEPLKKEILGFIKPIGSQILKWLEYHIKNCLLRIKSPNLCWTPEGTVDKKKTAEVLSKDENLNITKRYKLACIYCLEDDIPELWNKMPENCRKYFYSEDPIEVCQQELVVLWTYNIKSEVARMSNMIERKWQRRCSPYQYAFEYAAVGGNKAATRCFLQKLTSREREESLVRYAGYVANKRCDSAGSHTDFPKEHYADVLCFLLSQINEEQQIEVFKNYPYEVLKCLLDWPWQSLFMETANRMWDFLSEKNYDYLLRIIVDKVMDGYKDYDYRNLFEEFWQQSPNAHKRYVIDECANGFLLSKLFVIKDEKNIKLILKDATLIEKEKLILCDRGKFICQDLINGDEWDLLEFFIRECVPSKNEVIKFREKFAGRITFWCPKEEPVRIKDKWDKFFQLLDDFVKGFDNKKRSMEEGESSPDKRLQC